MPVTPKKLRRNRFRKDHRRLWGRRLMLALKLGGLMSVLLAFSALFMMGYAAVTQSEYFRTQAIEINGNIRLPRDVILSQAQLRPGDNLLAVNLQHTRKRLLAHPWIATARVTREIPEKLRLDIREHDALAVIDLGRRFILNSEGRIFKEFETEERLALPLVSGIDYTDIALGDDTLSPALAALLAVLRVSRTNGGSLPFEAIERIRFDAEMGITLIDRSGTREIRLGLAQYETKYARLDQLHRHLAQSGQWDAVRTVDLNHPDRVVVRLEAPPVPAKKRS
jgi:cell division protein FtsQ